MERSLGLMCGAGAVPALMARQARQQGWRVVAFAFAPPSAAVLGDAARVVPCDMREMGPVVGTLVEEKVTGVLLSGKFWMADLLRADGDDLLIDTAAILPPPHTEGRLNHVAVVGQRLTMRMAGSASPRCPRTGRGPEPSQGGRPE